MQATPAISLTATQSSSLLTSVDSTNYTSSGYLYSGSTSTQRVHSIHPPAGAVDASGNLIPDPADIGASSTITYTGITTGTWTSKIESTVTLENGIKGAASSSRHYIKDKIIGAASVKIDSDVGICDIYCCLKALNDRYEQAKCKNKELAEDYKVKIEDVTRLVTLYIQAISCGLTADASCYINDIKNISECGTECSCYGETDVPANIPIVSATSTNHTRLETSSSRLSVTSSGSGTSADPVIYNMELGASLSADVNYVAQNIHEANSRLRIAEENIDILMKDIVISENNPERLTMNISHSFSGLKIKTSIEQIYLTGSRFYNTDSMSLNIKNNSETNWEYLNNLITISNLHDSKWKDTDFYVEARVLDSSNLDIEVFNVDSRGDGGYGMFKYRFRDKIRGHVITNSGLQDYRDINVSFDLISSNVIKEK